MQIICDNDKKTVSANAFYGLMIEKLRQNPKHEQSPSTTTSGMANASKGVRLKVFGRLASEGMIKESRKVNSGTEEWCFYLAVPNSIPSARSNHPAADLFPEMTDAEYQELKADIQANGQREPIISYMGQILDGRHRDRACRELGIEPIVAVYVGNDPYGFVVSHNLHRRHLSESQRAMIAAKMAQRKLGDNQHKKEGTQICVPSQAEAAKLLNVSDRSVSAAAKVKREGTPELVKAVESGDMPVSAAATIAKLPAEQQKEKVAARKATPTKKARQRKQTGKPATRRRVGLRKAEEAIRALKGIPFNDAEQKEAFQSVVSFIFANAGDDMPEWGAYENQIDELRARTAVLTHLLDGHNFRKIGTQAKKLGRVKRMNLSSDLERLSYLLRERSKDVRVMEDSPLPDGEQKLAVESEYQPHTEPPNGVNSNAA